MIRYGTPWNEETVELLLKLRREGLSASQIAKQIGPWITRNAVIGKLHRMGLSLLTTWDVTPLTPDEFYRRKKRSIQGRNVPPRKFFKAEKPVNWDTAPVSSVTFADLEDHHCRFPFTSGSKTKFCGQDATRGPYCEEHHRRCYTGKNEI